MTARFEVRADVVDECERMLREFTEAVNANEDGTILYVSIREAENPTRFINVMAFRDEGAEARHRETPWVKASVDGLYPNTIDGVAFTAHDVVAGL